MPFTAVVTDSHTSLLGVLPVKMIGTFYRSLLQFVRVSAHFSRNRPDVSPKSVRSVRANVARSSSNMRWKRGVGHVDEVFWKIVLFPRTSDQQLQQNQWEELWKDLKYQQDVRKRNVSLKTQVRSRVVIPSGMCMFNIHASVRYMTEIL